VHVSPRRRTRLAGELHGALGEDGIVVLDRADVVDARMSAGVIT
jgi:hypothetical protein